MKTPHWVIEFTRTDVTCGIAHKCRFTVSKRNAPTKEVALTLADVTPEVHVRAEGTGYAYRCVDSDIRVSLVGAK